MRTLNLTGLKRGTLLATMFFSLSAFNIDRDSETKLQQLERERKEKIKIMEFQGFSSSYDRMIVDIVPLDVLMKLSTYENRERDLADLITIEMLMNFPLLEEESKSEKYKLPKIGF